MLYHHVLNTKDTKDTKATSLKTLQTAQRQKGDLYMRPNAVSYRVIGAAMKVHSALGAGILESAYDACLCYEFTRWGLHYQHQVKLPITYEGNKLSPAYTIDFIIEKCLIVEVKCVERVLRVHRAQLLSYLRLTGHTLGLLINFNVPHLREGIHRVINGPEEDL